jgi:hypothetical protein
VDQVNGRLAPLASGANHQRVGAISNSHVGREFEALALDYLNRSERLKLRPNFLQPLGVGRNKKAHCFDLGSDDPPVLVECKNHRWTASGSSPSAKLAVWREAMFYFHLAPKRFRKILFVLEDSHASKSESLAQHFVRLHSHLIPADVEVIQFDVATKAGERVY